MQLDSQHLLYLGIGALLVIALATILTRRVRAKINKDGFDITTDKGVKQDKVNVKQVDTSSVDIKNREKQDIDVKGISDSDIKIH